MEDATNGIRWIKSSYSGDREACVEVAWVKSSYSGDHGACVEAAALGGRVLVRDSKNPTGPVLSLEVRDWRALLATLSNTA